MIELASIIEEAFERRLEFNPGNVPDFVAEAVQEALGLLERGEARVAEKHDGAWRVNQWLKKAVLLYFRSHDNRVIRGGYTNISTKCLSGTRNSARASFRPPACGSCRRPAPAEEPTSPLAWC